jgi:hypothetical protein
MTQAPDDCRGDLMPNAMPGVMPNAHPTQATEALCTPR